MPTHHLKTWPVSFEDMLAGRKTFEVRRNDRDFAVGDELCLMEYAPGEAKGREWTGRTATFRVTYLIDLSPFGFEAVGMGIKRIAAEPTEHDPAQFYEIEHSCFGMGPTVPAEYVPDYLSDLADGDTITIRASKLTAEELESLPDWEGW